MVSNENSLVPSGTSIHRSEGKAHWQWWQLAGTNRRKTSQTNVYANAGIQQCLGALLVIPLWAMISYQQSGWTQVHAIASLLWLGLFILLLSFFRRHRHHILEVETSESGLILKSPVLKRNIRWSDIVDFFPAGTIEPRECVLQCKNGEEFFLPNDLSNSGSLFELIASPMVHPAITYELNYRLPDGYFDQARVCVVVVLGAIFLTIRSCLLSPGFGVGSGNLASLIFLSLVYALALAWCWLNLKKTPQLIRAGQLGIYVQTGTQSKVIPWEQITDIRQIAGWLVVNSRSGWFVLFGSKKEPMSEKLLEHKRNFLMLNQGRH